MQDILGQLAQVATADPALKAQVERSRSEHQALGGNYRKGRDAFVAAGADTTAGDQAVKGIDRAASEQMSALVEQLRQNSLSQAEQINTSAARTIFAGTVLMLVAALIIALSSLWLVNRNLIIPIRHLIGHVDQLSHGQFGQRELRPLANRLKTASNDFDRRSLPGGTRAEGLTARVRT